MRMRGLVCNDETMLNSKCQPDDLVLPSFMNCVEKRAIAAKLKSRVLVGLHLTLDRGISLPCSNQLVAVHAHGTVDEILS